jgi:hypothetical protein
VEIDQFPLLVQTVLTLLFSSFNGSMAKPEIQTTRTAVEKFEFVVFRTEFDTFRGEHLTVAKLHGTQQNIKKEIIEIPPSLLLG